MSEIIRCNNCDKERHIRSNNTPWWWHIQIRGADGNTHPNEVDLCSDECLAAWANARTVSSQME